MSSGTTVPTETAHQSHDGNPTSTNPANEHIVPSGTAPSNATEAVDKIMNDPEFMSEFSSESSAFSVRKIRSHIILLSLIAGGLYGAYVVLGVEILETWAAFVIVGVVTILGVYTTGGFLIDWWSLLLGHWWLSLPIGAAAGLALLM